MFCVYGEVKESDIRVICCLQNRVVKSVFWTSIIQNLSDGICCFFSMLNKLLCFLESEDGVASLISLRVVFVLVVNVMVGMYIPVIYWNDTD